ncbi:MAG: hypothetical protein ACD_37C00351G0004 [uncultured bacterium]|nr:MAG: hypothetical protein ACD_37C00351G0004 [uncultured bacterium]
MDVQNNQPNQINPTPSPTQAPVPPVVPGPVSPDSSSKKLIILVAVGAIILAVLGGALFFYMSSSSSKSTTVTESAPVAVTEEVGESSEVTSSVTAVQGVSDLDQLLVEVAQADSELEKQLVALEKDSDF